MSITNCPHVFLLMKLGLDIQYYIGIKCFETVARFTIRIFSFVTKYFMVPDIKILLYITRFNVLLAMLLIHYTYDF